MLYSAEEDSMMRRRRIHLEVVADDLPVRYSPACSQRLWITGHRRGLTTNPDRVTCQRCRVLVQWALDVAKGGTR